jgi:DNA-binding response OmpR family regulator
MRMKRGYRRSLVMLSFPRVLVVEDHEATRAALAGMFSRRGWDTRSTGTVAEALDCLSPIPDCVILDLNLPDGPGEAVLHTIQERELPVRIVAVVTATSEPFRLRSVASYRPDLTILKPFDWEILLRFCESAVGERCLHSGASAFPP